MKLIFPLFFLILSSCNDRPENWSKNKMLDMAMKADPNFTVIVPESISKSLVNCIDYTPSCLFGYKVATKKLAFIALLYKDQKKAYKAARRIDGYVSRNWAFDDVKGEPVLERFVQKVFKAYPARESDFK